MIKLSLHKFPRWMSFSLFLVTLLIGLAIISLFAIPATYNQRLDRMFDRVPYTTSGVSDSGFYAAGMNTTCNGLPVDTLRVRPISEDAPPPPGVSQWPAPGEALVSPAVFNLGCELNVGTYVGLIDPSVLADPGERLVYSNPPEDAIIDARFETYTHWGDIPDEAFHHEDFRYLNILGSPQYDQKITRFYGLWALTFALPTLLAFTAISGTYRSTLAPRDRALYLIGASPLQRFLHRVRHFYRPVIAAAIVNIISFLLITRANFIVPIVNFHFTGSDLIQVSVPLVTTLILLPFMIILATGLRTATRNLTTRKIANRKTFFNRLVPFAALACLALAIICTIFADLLLSQLPPGMFELLFMGSLIGTALFSAGLVAETSQRIISSSWLRKRAQNSSSMLIGVGLLRSSASAIMGFASTIAATIILVTFTTAFYEAFSRSDEGAVSTYEKYHNNIARVDRPPLSKEAVDKFENILISYGLDFVIPHISASSDNKSTLIAPYTQPQLIGSVTEYDRCTFSGADELLAEYLTSQALVDGEGCFVETKHPPITDYAINGSVIYIVYSTATPLDRDAVQKDLTANFAVPSTLELPGEDYLIGGNVLAEQGKWLILGTIVVTVLMLGAMWIFSASDFRISVKKIVPYLKLGAPPSLIWKVLGIRILVPTAIATIWAIISGTTIAYGFEKLFINLGTLRWQSLGVSLLFLVVLTVIVWVALSFTVMRKNVRVPAYSRVTSNHE